MLFFTEYGDVTHSLSGVLDESALAATCHLVHTGDGTAVPSAPVDSVCSDADAIRVDETIQQHSSVVAVNVHRYNPRATITI